ncbi:MAG: hypothetical protein KIS94_02955 [Chitinophagales bacterium]|nr:hypothetical protein [Chitinophagales bacterium]
MISFFKSNNPGVVVFYFVYLVVFRICFAFSPGIDVSFPFAHHEPLSALLFGWIALLPFNAVIKLSVLSALLNFFQALLVNRIVNENKMTAKKTYLPGAVFIVFTSFFKQTLVLSPASVALTFIILAVAALFRLARKEKAYGDVYDIGFLSAVVLLLYFPTVIFILFAFIGIATVRTFHYREWVAMLLGFVTPFFVAFTVYFVSGTSPNSFLPSAWLSGLAFSFTDKLTIATFTFLSLAVFALVPLVLQSALIQVRKFTTLMVILFFLLVPAFFLQQKVSLSYFVLFGLPVAVVASMISVQLKRSIIAEVMHIILILLVLAGQYLPVFNIL